MSEAGSEFQGTERFELTERLGAGAFGVVYRAFDRNRGTEVALKTLQRVEPNSLYLFKQEFRALTDIRHPNLAEIYGLFSEGDHWFFTMEFLEGVDFLTYVWGQDHVDGPGFQNRPTEQNWDVWGSASGSRTGAFDPTLRGTDKTVVGDSAEISAYDEASLMEPREVKLSAGVLKRLRGALRGLTRGVNALHAAGMLHRDLKPANVMVTPEGRVVVLDFGLVLKLGEGEAGSGQSPGLVGTPVYMSPEQAAEQEVTEASDWYSVGIMLFEALTGEAPVRGSIRKVLRRKSKGDGPAPSSRVSGVPAEFDELCASLLRLDPSARPTGPELARRLSAEDAATSRLGRRIREGESFVGRLKALLKLESAFEQARSGRPVIQFVRGESGVGKTALVEHFLADLAKRQEGITLAGRCYQQESVPYKAWDVVVDVLSRMLKVRKARELASILPAHLPELLRVFPVLSRIEAFAQEEDPESRTDPKEVQRRSFESFRELLGRLRRTQPLVIFVDDLQWSDRDSLDLLRQLFAEPNPPALLFIAVFRDDQSPPEALLEGLAGELGASVLLRDLKLGPLAKEEAQELARILLGRTTGRAAVVAKESGGKPVLLRELAFFGDTSSGRVSLAELVKRRIAMLSDTARALLEAAAIAARPTALPSLTAVAGLEAIAESALSELRSGHLAALRSDAEGADDALEVADDRLRGLVIEAIPEERQAEYHRALARSLEESGAPQQIAEHYLAGGEKTKAVDFLKRAAEEAEEALAFDRAAALYRRVIEVAGLSGAAALPYLLRQAEALSDAERPWDAAPVYLEAAAATSGDEALPLKQLAAHELLTSGRVAEGLEVLDEVLVAVDMELPTYQKKSDLIKILGRRLRYRFAPGKLGKTPRQLAELQADACQSMTMSMCLLNLRACIDFLTRFNILAHRLQDPRRIARGAIYEAWYQSVLGKAELSASIRASADAIIHGTDEAFLHGLAYFGSSVCALFLGRWREALVSGEEALQRFREYGKGVHWELALGRYYCQFSRIWMGRVQELSEILPAMLREARERGDLLMDYTLGTRILNDYLLIRDQPDQAEEEVPAVCKRWIEASGGLTGYTEFWEIYTELQRSLYRGEQAKALTDLRDYWPRMTPSFRMVLARFMGLSIKARIVLARGAELQGEERKVLREEALKAADELDTLGMACASARAVANRAGAASLSGEKARAAALLMAAEEAFRAADMELHAASSRRCRGLILVGEEQRRRLIDGADEAIKACGAEKPEVVASWLIPGDWVS